MKGDGLPRRRARHLLLSHFLQDAGIINRAGVVHLQRVRARVAKFLGVTLADVPMVLTPEWVARISTILPQLDEQRRANLAKWGRAQVRTDASVKAELDRAIAAACAELQAQFETQVAAQVSARVAERVAHLNARKQALDDLEVRRRARLASVVELLSFDEYRLVRSCLHPDRAPPDRVERFTEAFAIFQRFEAAANAALPVADLRARGWDHIAPYRRP